MYIDYGNRNLGNPGNRGNLNQYRFVHAVADVFDALISKRCYKDAMPFEKAYAIIREESGTHFDPAVVEAFFAVDKNNLLWANCKN